MSDPRHFITGTELTRAGLGTLIERAIELKAAGPSGPRPLRDRSIALLFEKPSTRTRVSFQVGISQLGGNALLLRSEELQLARGESVSDTALVLSRYVDAIVVPGRRARVDRGAGRARRGPGGERAHAAPPSLPGAGRPAHPAGALRPLEGLRVAYVGDGNNVCHSLMLLGARAGVEVVAATPPELRPEAAIVAEAGDLARARRRPGRGG